MKAGQTVEIKGGIYFNPGHGTYGAPFVFFSGNMSAFNGYTPVCEHTITVTVPAGFDTRTEEIKALEAQREAAQAAFTATICEINERIQKLMCIENSAEAS